MLCAYCISINLEKIKFEFYAEMEWIQLKDFMWVVTWAVLHFWSVYVSQWLLDGEEMELEDQVRYWNSPSRSGGDLKQGDHMEESKTALEFAVMLGSARLGRRNQHMHPPR